MWKVQLKITASLWFINNSVIFSCDGLFLRYNKLIAEIMYTYTILLCEIFNDNKWKYYNINKMTNYNEIIIMNTLIFKTLL